MDDFKSKRINKIFEFSYNNNFSSFYRDKYIKAKFKVVNTIDFKNFQEIPFLTKKEISDTPPLKRLFVAENEIGCWLRTSGTTSNMPLMIPASRHNQEHLDIIAELLAKNKIKKYLYIRPLGSLTIDLFDFSHHSKLSTYPLIMGDITNLDLTAKIVSEIEVDGIDCTPSALYFLLPYLKDVYDLRKIKFLRILGEYVSEQKLLFFKSYFKNAYFYFDIGAAEARGDTGFRCDYLNLYCPPRFYHTKSDIHYEVVDMNGNVLKNGQTGELVLTTLFKTPFPLIRYRTGDAVSIKETTCKCGRRYVMEIYGRIGYDAHRIGGITLYRHLVENAIQKAYKDFKGDYELHVFETIYNNRLVPSLVLKIDLPVKNKQSFIMLFEKELKVSSNINLERLVKYEIFAPTTLEIDERFEANRKDVKIFSHIK